jgi:precorrin-2 dehydrogenase/sirohydrochlorin ferrochelatase
VTVIDAARPRRGAETVTADPAHPPERHYYMACLDLQGRDVLVVGGGSVALEKANGLLDGGASVIVVSPEIDPELRALPVEWLPRRYETGDLAGRHLVIAATSDTAVNTAVFQDAERRNVFCNVVDVPELCSLILPAVHRQGPIAVAVSTSGASPALAKRIRDEVAALIGPEHAELAERLYELRPWAKENLATYDQRKEYFEQLVEEALP